jgi:protein transport protein SEC24
MCHRVHDLPADFDYDPVKKAHIEITERPELRFASVEYIAPTEYMVRPPQPCVHVFLIDVSVAAIANGNKMTKETTKWILIF